MKGSDPVSDTKNIAKKTTKASQTRERIVGAYLDLIPQKKWDKISVKDLCAHSGITRGTFYQYFNDIYDLMQHIQDSLMQEMTHMYGSLPQHPHIPMNAQIFDEKFNCSPPEQLLCWFKCSHKNRKAMAVLLDPENGDSYFVKKIKTLLREQINEMMDHDGMPRDSLREHFLKIFIELHFLSVRTWLNTGTDDFLSVDAIINLLNTMRVGANYLHYKRAVQKDFDVQIHPTQDSKKDS